MKNPRLIDLQIKIASLAAESRIIREKEGELKHEAYMMRGRAIGKEKGLTLGPKVEMPPDLLAETQRRTGPNFTRIITESGDFYKADASLIRTARKAIRKYVRAGMTKEQILALPGVQKSLQYTAKVDDLCQHRKLIVRPESRNSQLAYAFLRGKPYSKTEDKAKNYPNWDKVADIAARFSGEDKRIVAQRFEQWRQEAHSLIKGNELMRMKSANKLAA